MVLEWGVKEPSDKFGVHSTSVARTDESCDQDERPQGPRNDSVDSCKEAEESCTGPECRV